MTLMLKLKEYKKMSQAEGKYGDKEKREIWKDPEPRKCLK